MIGAEWLAREIVARSHRRTAVRFHWNPEPGFPGRTSARVTYRWRLERGTDFLPRDLHAAHRTCGHLSAYPSNSLIRAVHRSWTVQVGVGLGTN